MWSHDCICTLFTPACSAGGGRPGARGGGRDGGEWRSVGRQQLQPLQHLEELPPDLQSALFLQGEGGRSRTAAVGVTCESGAKSPKWGTLGTPHRLKLGPAGSKRCFRFGFSGVKNADSLLGAVSMSAGAHDHALATFTLVKRCASVPNSQWKLHKLSGIAAR